MKILKRILMILLIFIITGGTAGFFYFKNKFMSAPPNRLTLSGLGQPFEFIWSGGDINGNYEPHMAMFVPVSIPGIDRSFHMQFDLGSHSTFLNYNSVLSINEAYDNLFQIDTIKDQLLVTDVTINVGTVKMEASSIDFKGKGRKIDWSDSTSVINIGTIGADFIEKHALIMDFKNEQITLMESVPGIPEPESDHLPFTFDGRKIFLSAKLNNEPVSLWYDSGSSAFEFIVEEKAFLKLATPGAERETYTANSWGTGVTIHNLDSNGEFEFGATRVPLTYVTYIEWPNKIQAWMMKASNIGGDLGGMTGNKLFLGKTLVLDAPNLRYRVMN